MDEANRADSAIRLQALVLNPEQLQQKTVTVVSQPQLATKLGFQPEQQTASTFVAGANEPPVFTKPEEQKVAQIAYDVIRKMENKPTEVPSVAHLQKPEVQAAIVRAVEEQYRPAQMTLEGVIEKPDIAAVVAKTVEVVEQQTINIPRILVVPKGEVKSGFKPFQLNLDSMRYQSPSEEIWIQMLRTNQLEVLSLGKGGVEEQRLEDYVVSGLVDFDDISYDDHADLLYDLAAQTVRHFTGYLSEEDTRKVLRYYQRDIAKFIHAQMQDHYWEEAVGYEVKVSKGFMELKKCAYTASATESPLNYPEAPADRSNMAKYLFGGFERCLYSLQKFQSDPERKLAVILEREALKWFRPIKGQFQLFYKVGAEHQEYQPDFVTEAADCIYMIEPKRASQMTDADVLAKRDAAVKWCRQASEYANSHGGKPWKYALIPDDAISTNMTLVGLVERYGLIN